SETPVRVAGFNYGKFKKLAQSDKDSGMTVEVYTNPGTPDVVRQINSALEAMSAEEGGGPSFVHIDTGKLAQSALADGINTARTGNVFYGPLAHRKVAITQQSEWSFGLLAVADLYAVSGVPRWNAAQYAGIEFIEGFRGQRRHPRVRA